MEQVVVVEDFAAIRTLFEEMLIGAGYAIFAAADSPGGAQAVIAQCIAEGVVPIFVIGDLLLPDDREELLKTIAEKIPHAQIVSCSLYPPALPLFTGVHVSKVPGVRERLLHAMSLLPSADA